VTDYIWEPNKPASGDVRRYGIYSFRDVIRCWEIPVGRSAIVEVYPALWSGSSAREDRTGDQHDAYSIAAWMRRADLDGSLAGFLNPCLTPAERAVAQVEGWILGVPGLIGEARQSKNNKAHKSMTPSWKQEHGRSMKMTTDPGYINRNGQTVLRRSDERGNDHNQFVYVMRCMKCAHEYGANGSDIWQRRCPSCNGGATGLAY
jgi:hypothetical protein